MHPLKKEHCISGVIQFNDLGVVKWLRVDVRDEEIVLHSEGGRMSFIHQQQIIQIEIRN